MIVVDTSALVAILKFEPMAAQCTAVLGSTPDVIMSAGTLVEARIVATRGGKIFDLEALVEASIREVIPVTEDRARFISDVYGQWGKGFNKAGLNFGDCFAYATAKEFDCPLLFVGDDFARTDIRSAITPDAVQPDVTL